MKKNEKLYTLDLRYLLGIYAFEWKILFTIGIPFVVKGFKISSNLPPSGADMHMTNLIDGGRWHVAVSESLFDTEEVEAIRKIPLPLRPVQDKRGWHYTKSSSYTVKSGYRSLSLTNGNLTDVTIRNAEDQSFRR